MATSAGALVEILDLLTERICRYRVDDHVVVYCNGAWAARHATSPQDVVGRVLDDFLGVDELAGLRSQLARLGPDAAFLADPHPRPCPSEPDHWVEWTDRWLDGPGGPQVLAVGRDVTERRRTQLELARSEQRFRNLAELSADLVWHFSLDPEPHLGYLSPSVETLTGWSATDVGSDLEHLRRVLDADSLAVVEEAVARRRLPDRLDLTVRRPDGTRVVLEVQTVRLPEGAQGVARDVTEVRRLQADLAAQALHDPLTGLANRRLLAELLGAALDRAPRRDVAVSYVDLDGFKPLNDTHGHAFGDAVLVEVARRIQEALRDADVVARVGGDEFVIVHETAAPMVRRVTARVARAIGAPMVVEGVDVAVGATIGTVVAEPGQHIGELLAAADAAMYREKRRRTAGGARRP